MTVEIWDVNHFGIIGLIIICVQVIFFIITVVTPFHQVTDLAGGLNFIIVAVTSLLLAEVS